MDAPVKIRTTKGRGKLFDSILDTVGDTPVIRVNNLGPDGVTIYVKAELFNPAGSVKDHRPRARHGVRPEGRHLHRHIGGVPLSRSR